MWRVAAEFVFWFHILWIVALIVGLIVCWMPRYARMGRWVAFGVFVTWFSQMYWGGCPLTKLELFFLAKHNPRAVFEEPFIVHYVRTHSGIAVRSWHVDVALGVMTALIILVLFTRRKK